MNIYNIITFVICITALFSYLNHRFIKWSPTIGVMVLSLMTSVIIIIAGHLFPSVSAYIIGIVSAIDFHTLLMKVMLGFLLFAGATHIDAGRLKQERVPIIILATIGTIISTFLIGTLVYYMFMVFHAGVAYIYCLLFAALISPTDPIAVLAILKQAGIRQSLEVKISGESLFNDGVAVVIFITILETAQGGTDHLSFLNVATLFLREAGGGLLYGAVLGYVGFLAMRAIDNYQVEVLITIAMVMGGYMLADMIHVSGPLAMVVAGITVGNKARNSAMSAETKDYIHKFWELIDEILNAVLFLLIGFEMLVIKVDKTVLLTGLIAIVLVLLARWISVALPVLLMRRKIKFERHAIAILTWGGLRGGLSVALALSLPQEMYRDRFVPITYIIVIFSIVVQGLTIGKVAAKLKSDI